MGNLVMSVASSAPPVVDDPICWQIFVLVNGRKSDAGFSFTLFFLSSYKFDTEVIDVPPMRSLSNLFKKE